MGLSIKKGIILKGLALFLIFYCNPYVWADWSYGETVKPIRSLSDSVRTEICHVLENKSVLFQIGSRIETTASGDELIRFYQNNQCFPVWSDENSIDSQVLFMINAITHSAADGVDIHNPIYNFESILSLMELIRSDSSIKNNPIVLAQLDILLTDAYMMLGKDLYYGFAPRDKGDGKGMTSKPSIDFAVRLVNALRDKNVRGSLEELSPSSHGYQALRTVMVKYLKIKESGGWKPISSFYPNANEIELYSMDELKDRLMREGYLASGENSDEEYQNGVKNFQISHGLNPDGKVGVETLSKMNITVEEKIAAIRLNLERWRWMPQETDNYYLSVNIPDFSLSVVKNDKTQLRMKAIVGKAGRETPLINAGMKYIVINPYWRVPNTILREDIFPKVRKDIRYLQKERIRIFKSVDSAKNKEISPYAINWKKANANTFPYFLRQDPGAKNVLGRLKFIFPNPNDIYIHDTPAKSLFEKQVRTFSSGCIRVQEPLNLAHYLLKNDGNDWGDANIETLIAKGIHKYIVLSKPVKVRIDYWTVWTDDEGVAHFRDDVYGHDADLAEMLGLNLHP